MTDQENSASRCKLLFQIINLLLILNPSLRKKFKMHFLSLSSELFWKTKSLILHTWMKLSIHSFQERQFSPHLHRSVGPTTSTRTLPSHRSFWARKWFATRKTKLLGTLCSMTLILIIRYLMMHTVSFTIKRIQQLIHHRLLKNVTFRTRLLFNLRSGSSLNHKKRSSIKITIKFSTWESFLITRLSITSFQLMLMASWYCTLFVK